MPVSSSVGQRFSQLIQQLGMSKNAFAMSLDKTATVIQHLVDERNKPGFDLMNKVFEVYPNVSVDWLLRGHGPMLRDSLSPLPAAVATPLVAAPEAAPAALTQPRVVPAMPVFPEPLFTVSVASQPSPETPTPPSAPLVAAPQAVTVEVPPAAPTQSTPAPSLVEALSEPTPPVPPPPAPNPAATAIPPAAPDAAYLTAALHAQYLQHQLALAEQRNQHLLEQQQLMQQMLTMLQSR